MLNEKLKNSIYKNIGTILDIDNADIVHLMKNANSNTFVTANSVNSLVVPIKSNTVYTVDKILSARFGLYTSENYPESSGALTNSIAQSGATELTITSGNSDHYLTILYYNSSYDTTPEATIKASLKVYEGSIQEEVSYGQYLDEKINNINKNMLDSELKNSIYKVVGTDFDISNCEQTNLIKFADGNYFVSAEGVLSLIVPIENNTKYIVQKIQSTRFALYTSQSFPMVLGGITNSVGGGSATELQITSGANDRFLTIYYYNSSSDTLTEEAIRNSITIYKNTIVQSETQFDNLKNELLISDQWIKLVSTKYLGSLTKGYIAISCDDGANSLADITVDIFKGYKTTYNKNIPLTMGLMSNSQIFSDDTRKTKVLDLIQNYGASIAIHGSSSYTSYTNKGLFNFLNQQKQYLTDNLAAPTSIIYPNHDYNEKTSTIAGTYYGVCCTGGNNFPITYDGQSKLAGPRSNMYTLYRFSLFNAQMTNQKIKNAIDYAYEHNMIFLPFFHDSGLVNDYERCKALLDYCVQYANEKGLEFINVGDIPNII